MKVFAQCHLQRSIHCRFGMEYFELARKCLFYAEDSLMIWQKIDLLLDLLMVVVQIVKTCSLPIVGPLSLVSSPSLVPCESIEACLIDPEIDRLDSASGCMAMCAVVVVSSECGSYFHIDS